MKKLFFNAVLLIISCHSFSQTKEKVKGSRIITQNNIEIENFTAIEAEDDFEIILSKGDKPSLEIVADDNLHDIISSAVVNNVLKISALKEPIRAKKFTIRINYTDSLNSILAKGETKISSLNTVELEELTIKSYGKSKLILNIEGTKFSIALNDKTKAELNITAENSAIEVSQNANLEAVITNDSLAKIDIYQSGKAKIDGKTNELKIRIDNSGNLTGKKFTAKKVQITAEGNSKSLVFVDEKIIISASGKSQIELYGEPKIEILKFTNSTTLSKKE